jgi:hypothetical protein
MGAPSSGSLSTSSMSYGPGRCSTDLIEPLRRGDETQPTRSPKSNPALPPPESKESPPPFRVPALWRSSRTQNHLRIHGLPSGTTPSAPRRRRRSPSSSVAAPHKTIDAWTEEWGREKAASGAWKEECVLPFLRKDASRKVRGWTTQTTFYQFRLFCARVRMRD